MEWRGKIRTKTTVNFYTVTDVNVSSPLTWYMEYLSYRRHLLEKTASTVDISRVSYWPGSHFTTQSEQGAQVNVQHDRCCNHMRYLWGSYCKKFMNVLCLVACLGLYSTPLGRVTTVPPGTKDCRSDYCSPWHCTWFQRSTTPFWFSKLMWPFVQGTQSCQKAGKMGICQGLHRTDW